MLTDAPKCILNPVWRESVHDIIVDLVAFLVIEVWAAITPESLDRVKSILT